MSQRTISFDDDAVLPKYPCSFANLWFNLLIYSNRLTYERLIYKYIVYTMYIAFIFCLIYSLSDEEISSKNIDEKKYWITFTVIFYVLGSIGVLCDIFLDYDSSPTQEILKCCKCKKKNDNSGCDVQSTPASQTVTEV